MEAGAASSPTVGDAGLSEEPAEVLVDVAVCQWQAGPAGEEPVPAFPPDELGVVVGKPHTQRLGDGHLPVFAALGVADLQNSGVGIDIVGAQQAGFGAAQTAGIDRPEQDRHDETLCVNLQ